MIYSEKWSCCSGMRVFKTMHLHNCIFILPILMCDFCLLALLWFESPSHEYINYIKRKGKIPLRG